MSCGFEDIEFEVGSGSGVVPLRLRRCLPDSGASAGSKGAVLLLHGGNTSSDTFLLPRGGIARYLKSQGWDVWLLDWRSSPYVLERVLCKGPLGGSEKAERQLYSLDRVVEEDIPEALLRVRERIGETQRLSILGHCVGGGAVSIAVARGKLEPFRLAGVVLSTLGLFYEVPWNGWIKAEDYIVERVLGSAPRCRQVDPIRTEEWPNDMQAAYDRWPRSWLPKGDSAADELLRRLSFMLGQPYDPERLDPSIQDDVLLRQFGPVHLGIYLHLSQMVRRGYAGQFDTLDVIDRPRTKRCKEDVAKPEGDDLRPEFFLNKRVTLIAAAENQIWHRDAIDIMYDWLRSSEPKHQNGYRHKPVRFFKHVFHGYRIQELFWGTEAEKDVYPRIAEAITF